ncbi:MAG: hypothetical protein K6U87_06010 [Firmicutes bacterium]|nr:hypothetical protein [Bacillota bacterium]
MRDERRGPAGAGPAWDEVALWALGRALAALPVAPGSMVIRGPDGEVVAGWYRPRSAGLDVALAVRQCWALRAVACRRRGDARRLLAAWARRGAILPPAHRGKGGGFRRRVRLVDGSGRIAFHGEMLVFAPTVEGCWWAPPAPAAWHPPGRGAEASPRWSGVWRAVWDALYGGEAAEGGPEGEVGRDARRGR